jgi:hypothetical protein
MIFNDGVSTSEVTQRRLKQEDANNEQTVI